MLSRAGVLLSVGARLTCRGCGVGGCGVEGCCEVRWEEMMGGSFGGGPVDMADDRTTDLRDGIVRGCVPRYGDTATCCLGR